MNNQPDAVEEEAPEKKYGNDGAGEVEGSNLGSIDLEQRCPTWHGLRPLLLESLGGQGGGPQDQSLVQHP